MIAPFGIKRLPRKRSPLHARLCVESALHAVIHSNSEPGEAHIQSDDSTHSGSELGEAHSQNDDYIYSHSELGAAHIRDDVIVPFFGNSEGNYADKVMLRPFDDPWARSIRSGSTSSVIQNEGSIKTDDNDDLDIEVEHCEYEVIFKPIQTIETNPESGAAATAMDSGYNHGCSQAVSACADACRKADAHELAPFKTSSNAEAPRAALAYERPVLHVMSDESIFKADSRRISEAVSDIEMSKEENSNAFENSLVNIASLPGLDDIKKTFANATSCVSSCLCKGESNIKRKRKEASRKLTT